MTNTFTFAASPTDSDFEAFSAHAATINDNLARHLLYHAMPDHWDEPFDYWIDNVLAPRRAVDMTKENK